MSSKTDKSTLCYHCGDVCDSHALVYHDKPFCCEGCLTVHKVLQAGGLDNYYEFESHPGKKQNGFASDFNYLDNEEIWSKLVTFSQGDLITVRLMVPAIHCSSCVWLLENLDRLNPGVKSVRVDFLQKSATILIDRSKISIRELAELLSRVGYEPRITLDAEDKQEQNRSAERQLLYRLAIAGFCFGNVMLFSFPEYFGLNALYEGDFARLFSGLNLALSIPALLYSGSEYLVSAWKSLRSKNLHINVPLAIGMIALFGRTAWEILSGTGVGYADSLTGLIFFLLVGKWFQQKTYDSLSFERDYRSYFPLAVTYLTGGEWKTKPLSSVKVGDRLKVRNGELIPVDGYLLRGTGAIDYSFVTGESVPVSKELGEIIYAGGRQTGDVIEIEVLNEVEQSQLTQLWNAGSKEPEAGITYFADRVGRWFTVALLAIASVTFAVWAFTDLSMAFFAFTSVLIVACPCALALSSPFALGNAMRILGRAGMYLKNYRVVEDMAGIDHVVFDKTGTLTESGRFDIEYFGDDLNEEQKKVLRSMAASSTHPYSRGIHDYLNDVEEATLSGVSERPGKGLSASSSLGDVQMGSAKFVHQLSEGNGGEVHFKFADGGMGMYRMSNHYRPYIQKLTAGLKSDGYGMTLLSGDGSTERNRLKNTTTGIEEYFFNMDPVEKRSAIARLKEDHKVMMIGDGLNDAGALQKADVGVVITEDTNNFTPAAKAILVEKTFAKLPAILRYSKRTLNVIRWSLVFSLLYNITGIVFAVQGMLSPVLAAILMPASSISVVALNTLATTLIGRKENLI